MTRSTPWTKERFLGRLTNTDDPSACWEWAGSRSNGYGHLRIAGRDWKAHRFAYELFVGPIPEGYDVAHKCDNPPCCNPAHLFAGTTRDNIMDMLAKGRRIMPKGSAHGRAKMTEATVREIRALWASGTMTQKEIAAKFGLHPQRVNSVVNRRTWTHI